MSMSLSTDKEQHDCRLVADGAKRLEVDLTEYGLKELKKICC